MPVQTTYTLPRITPGSSSLTALSILNAPIIAALNALNEISSKLTNMNNKSAVIRQHVAVDSSVFVGCLVYWDTTSSTYKPALAALLNDPGDIGQSVLAPSSRVEGLIVSLDSGSNTGTLLCGGYYESSTVINACIADTLKTANTYYLSPTVAGKCTADPGLHLRQPVISYHGNGQFTMSIFYMAHDNHFHKSMLLDSTKWKSASEGGGGVTPPSGYTYVYDATEQATFGDISEDTTTIFVDGKLETTGSGKRFYIYSGLLWYKQVASTDETTPANYAVNEFNFYPFAYGSAVVRSISSLSDGLVATNTGNGSYLLSLSDYTAGSLQQSSVAVSNIADNTLSFTPVVSNIAAGSGISITTDTAGGVVVSASKNIGNPLDACFLNHNGTIVTSDNLYTYYCFPSGRISSMVIGMPVTDTNDSVDLKAACWIQTYGQSSALTVSMFFVPLGDASTMTDLPTSALAVTSSISLTGYENKLVYGETASTVEVTDKGMLVAKLVASNPTADLKLFRMGFKLYDSTSSVSTVVKYASLAVNYIAFQGTRGELLSAYTPIRIEQNKLYGCAASSSANAGKCVGLLIDGGPATDPQDPTTQATYVVSGLLNNSNWSFTPGGPLYISATGELTQTIPSATAQGTTGAAAFIQQIGIALTSTTININIGPATLLGE